ncbi:MAG TPA: sulfatase [Thermoanaerobaculia bacterium]|nr:sulfatase [Thermoanaerobaculia bacterium]
MGGETREATLAPGARERLEIEVPAGEASLRLSADGAADGLFLLGVPRLAAAAGERRRGPAPPPIVLVTLDTTRRDALGAYGAPPTATPSLDRFAETATVYEDAISTTSWTLPSHVSMFTGLYPSRHGLGVSRRWLPAEIPTLAGLLRRRGYTPVGVAGGLLISHRLGGARDFVAYRDPLGGRESPADRVTDFALRLLDETEGETPFLFVNYFDPHYRYEAPPEYQERAGVPEARAALRSPFWLRAATGYAPAWNRLLEGEAELTEPGLAWLRAVYQAEVAFMDAEVGRLFDELRRRSLWDDALVVVVADHGELLGEGGYLTHSYRLDPELVEVPLLVKVPGQRRGRRMPGVVSVTDLFPTLLAAAGVTAPPGDGRRLEPGSGRPDRDRRPVLFEEHASRVHPMMRRTHLYVAHHLWGYQGAGRRAVVWHGGAECRRRDRDGVWRAEECPDDGARLLAALVETLGEPPADAAAEGGELSEDQRAALEALGYL